MNTINHLYIGRLIYRYLKKKYNYTILRPEFLFGNIVPDFYPNVILKPHYINNYYNEIKNEIWLLSMVKNDYKQKPVYFLKLGRICHYISDFFCTAHNINFAGNSRQHFQYEYHLSRFCKQNIKRLNKIDFLPVEQATADFETFMFNFEHLHKEFLKGEQDFSSDLFYAVYACTQVLEYMLKP